MAKTPTLLNPGEIDPLESARTREIIERSRRMFSKQSLWLPLWQLLAEQYHPVRADFTTTRQDWSEVADHLFESTPVLHRRDFSLAMGALLRPPGKSWFEPRAMEDMRNTENAIAWFNHARDTMRSHIYATRSRFRKAFRESDDDFSTFGNSVVGITENKDRSAIRAECFHLRDCAWAENADGEVDCLDRKEKFTLRRIRDTFGEKALRSGDLQILKDNPNHERSILICCMPAEMYAREKAEEMRRRLKGANPITGGWVVCYIDEEQQRELRCDTYPIFPYWVRRWELQRGSVYAVSPPAMMGLPDARMAQVLAQITQEAAEKQIDPPLVATRDAVWEGPNTFAGGVTWIDKEYDERLGDAIRPLDLGKNAGVGLDIRADLRALHANTFYINKLSLPLTGNMTAYEVSQRIDEYIRSIGPVFEPFEEDNARLLEMIFAMLARLGAFGPAEMIPPEISDAEIKFTFETPVQQAYERRKMLAAQELYSFAGMVAQTTGDAEVYDNLNNDAAIRTVGTNAIGIEMGLLNDPDSVIEKRVGRMQEAEAAKAKQAQAEQMAMLEQGLRMVPSMAQADQLLGQILGPDWMQGLMGALGGGGEAPQSNRLLPPPPGEGEEEGGQQVMPPMGMPSQPPMRAQQPGFAGRMAPQEQPEPMEKEDSQLAAVLGQLSEAINFMAMASMAESEVYKGEDGKMRSRKILPVMQGEAS